MRHPYMAGIASAASSCRSQRQTPDRIPGQDCRPPTATATTGGAPAKPWTVPRTPWATPICKGCGGATTCPGRPMERPENFAGRTVLNDDKFAPGAAPQRQAEVDSEESPSSGPRATTGPPSHWGERGKPSRQASLIVDPADGRFRR